ncbi:winged helix-turn-helix domain-containing protein [Streptomyces sp. Y7]|uniref:winged helix-turn-helix domain-containing protein n=1 Tax=Streptomyces sp. Y7 TaxID=3342392 RepID=UPI00370FC80A
MENTEPKPSPHDPRALMALAHPLRIRLITALRENGPATATQLAAHLGETSGTTSYHLRQLAEHGFIKENAERGTGRDRFWEATNKGVRADNIEDFVHHPDRAVRGALGLHIHEAAHNHAKELSTWLHSMSDMPAEWNGSWDISNFTLKLSPEDARELEGEIHDLIESYREKEADKPSDDLALRLHIHAFPRPVE